MDNALNECVASAVHFNFYILFFIVLTDRYFINTVCQSFPVISLYALTVLLILSPHIDCDICSIVLCNIFISSRIFLFYCILFSHCIYRKVIVLYVFMYFILSQYKYLSIYLSIH